MAGVPADKMRIGRSLLAGGPITQQMLQKELERSSKTDSVLGKALLQAGFPREEELVAPLLARLRIPKINARNTKIPLETIRLIPGDVAQRCRVLPIDQIGSILVVVTPDIGNEEGMAEVRLKTGSRVTPIQCAPDGFDQIVADYYKRLKDAGLEPLTRDREEMPIGVVSANGNFKAIPAGSENEDTFWKCYMTSGPIPAEEVML